jgi:putative ABC transport system ATP-binding protein
VEAATRRRGRAADGFRLEVPSFRVAAGECVALTGPSGSGKSTMLDLLGLVLRPDGARAFVMTRPDGTEVDVAGLWQRDDRDALASLRARHIGYVLQTGGLLPFLTAGENIGLSRSLLGLGRGSTLVGRLIEALGLGQLLRRKPQALSIGERQRVAIARALAHRPALLLADEPTAALDPAQAMAVMRLLLDLAAELAVGTVVVSHDWDLVRRLELREVRAQPLQGGPATAFAG